MKFALGEWATGPKEYSFDQNAKTLEDAGGVGRRRIDRLIVHYYGMLN